MSKNLHFQEIIFNLNTRLFNNSLANITQEQAQERISDHSNPINWIAAHLVWARYLMLVFFGKPVQNPYNNLYENFKSFDPSLTYPSLSEVKEEWQKVTGLLKDALASVTEEQLAADSPVKSPVEDFTNAGTIAFLEHHESYTIGQLSFLKKYFTKEAMSYS